MSTTGNSTGAQSLKSYDDALEEWCNKNKFTKVMHTTNEVKYDGRMITYDTMTLSQNYVTVAYRELRIRSAFYRAGLAVNQIKGADAAAKEIIGTILNTNVLGRYRDQRDTWFDSMNTILREHGLDPPPARSRL